VDDIFVLLSIPGLVGYISSHGFKEGIDKFPSELGLVVDRAPVGLNVSLKALNKIRYLGKGFFLHF